METASGQSVGNIRRGYKMSRGRWRFAGPLITYSLEFDRGGFPSEDRLISRVNGKQREMERSWTWKKKDGCVSGFFFCKKKIWKKVREVKIGKIEFYYCFSCFYFILICEQGIRRDRELIWIWIIFFPSLDDDILENIKVFQRERLCASNQRSFVVLRVSFLSRFLILIGFKWLTISLHDDILKKKVKFYNNLSSISKFILNYSNIFPNIFSPFDLISNLQMRIKLNPIT